MWTHCFAKVIRQEGQFASQIFKAYMNACSGRSSGIQKSKEKSSSLQNCQTKEIPEKFSGKSRKTECQTILY